MNKGAFVKKIISILCIGQVLMLADVSPVHAFSGEDIFAGANSLVKDAIDKIKNGPDMELL